MFFLIANIFNRSGLKDSSAMSSVCPKLYDASYHFDSNWGIETGSGLHLVVGNISQPMANMENRCLPTMQHFQGLKIVSIEGHGALSWFPLSSTIGSDDPKHPYDGGLPTITVDHDEPLAIMSPWKPIQVAMNNDRCRNHR